MMQRAGTLRYVGPSRPGPLHHRPAWGNSSKQEPASQVNRGPKKQGRSDRLFGSGIIRHYISESTPKIFGSSTLVLY